MSFFFNYNNYVIKGCVTTVTRSRVLPSKCTRRYGVICALCFDTLIELCPGSTITDGDETKGGDSTIFSLNLNSHLG